MSSALLGLQGRSWMRKTKRRFRTLEESPFQSSETSLAGIGGRNPLFVSGTHKVAHWRSVGQGADGLPIEVRFRAIRPLIAILLTLLCGSSAIAPMTKAEICIWAPRFLPLTNQGSSTMDSFCTVRSVSGHKGKTLCDLPCFVVRCSSFSHISPDRKGKCSLAAWLPSSPVEVLPDQQEKLVEET